jgi:hypothetical protein
MQYLQFVRTSNVSLLPSSGSLRAKKNDRAVTYGWTDGLGSVVEILLEPTPRHFRFTEAEQTAPEKNREIPKPETEKRKRLSLWRHSQIRFPSYYHQLSKWPRLLPKLPASPQRKLPPPRRPVVAPGPRSASKPTRRTSTRS